MIYIQLGKRHPRALLAVPTVVLHIRPRLEVQRLGAPRRTNALIPLTVRGVHTQQPRLIEVDHVGEALLQRHIGRHGDHPPFAVIRAHAHLGDDIAGLGFFLELVFQLDQRLLAVVRMNLPNHDFAGRGHLIDGQGGAQEVVRIRVGPVAQAPIGVGLAQFAARVHGIFGAGAGDGGPELHVAAFGLEILVLEAAHQLWGLDGGGRGADRNAQVPGGKINHGVGLFTEGYRLWPLGQTGSL
ncbi:Uncharacterized protein PFLU_5699 [Pseudomonas [fluorescens] SBW25]|uniref:Uncharacterized protein n=1 Tax=Pseudomonas fluorescens (strain SBW25) TaxID=216595 RepID=C3K3E6_PSEFS|nr:Uncharacterized protein PFLU_5699 [Pseudomonas fluorescens SBW25]